MRIENQKSMRYFFACKEIKIKNILGNGGFYYGERKRSNGHKGARYGGQDIAPDEGFAYRNFRLVRISGIYEGMILEILAGVCEADENRKCE